MHLMDGIGVVIAVCIVIFVGISILKSLKTREVYPILQGHIQTTRDWLEKSGYEIVRVHDFGECIGYYDTQTIHKQLTADFIVRKHGRYYAVIVTCDEDESAMGGRLFDTWFPVYTAFQVHGILQVDVHSERIRLIDFDVKSPKPVRYRKLLNRSLWFLAGVVSAFMFMHKQ